MSNVLPVLVILGFGLGVSLLIRRGVLSQRRANLAALAHAGTASESAIAMRVLRTMRNRNLAVMAAVIFGAILALFANQAFPTAHGLALVLMPVSTWILVLVVLLLWPIPHEFKAGEESVGSAVSAELIPRSNRMFGPVWAVLAPAVLISTSVLGLLIAGFMSSADENGQFRMLPYHAQRGAQIGADQQIIKSLTAEGLTGPFPGWYYGAPLIALLLLSALLTLWALNGNVRRPSLRSVALQDFDKAVRTHYGHFLSTGFTAMLCFQLIPPLIMAAGAIYNAGQNAVYMVGATMEDANVAQLSTEWSHLVIALALAALALLLLILSVILLGQLVGWIGVSVKAAEIKTSQAGVLHDHP